MESQDQKLLSQKQLESFFLNQSIDINFVNFFTAIILSLILGYVIKYTYIKVSRTIQS